MEHAMTQTRGRARFLWSALKYGVSALCLLYAFWDVPFAALGSAMKNYSLLPMLAALLVSFISYALMSLRLSRMTTPPFSFRSTFAATLVGLAVNNVLPARAGEIAKAVWMGRGNDVPFHKTLGIVFMERFFDVNVLAVLNLWFLWEIGGRGSVSFFVFFLAAGWCVLAFFRLCPAMTERFTGLFGGGGLRRFVSQALAGVLENMSPAALAWLTATSLVLWFVYSLQMYLSLNEVAGLGLPWRTALAVFTVSGLSMLLPSSPGAIGVYEAVTVTVLKNCGVGGDAALAATLFAHMVQFIPATLAGGLIFAAFPENTG